MLDTIVIEIYGMTETAGVICSNPLPPAEQKAGSVGLPCGCDLRIVDDRGKPLPTGQRGEVVVRGDSVLSAYQDLPDRHREDFFGAYFCYLLYSICFAR